MSAGAPSQGWGHSRMSGSVSRMSGRVISRRRMMGVPGKHYYMEHTKEFPGSATGFA